METKAGTASGTGAISRAVPEPSSCCVRRLPLGYAARELLDLLLGRAARLSPLCLGGGLFAGGALQRLPFLLVFNLGGICHLVPLSLESVKVSRKSGEYSLE